MKRLYIIRHAKSAWKNTELDDFLRPLNKRGKVDAPLMGEVLKSKNIMPDIILSSPALRAKTTAQAIAKKIEYPKDIVYDEDIYESTPDTLHRILAKIDDKNSTAFLFGHNPSLNMLADMYVGFNENLPTCGVVEIEFDCDKWSEINHKNAKLASFYYPKKYKEKG